MTGKDKQLNELGLFKWKSTHWNLSTPRLVEEAIKRNEGILANNGALVVTTGKRTGRSPNDRFIVEEETTKGDIAWGKVNQPISEAIFNRLHSKILAFLQGKDLFIEDCFVGQHPDYSMPIRIVSQLAWGALFAKTLFVGSKKEKEAITHLPEFTVLHAPFMNVVPDLDGTKSDAFVIINFKKKMVLIGGTRYGGEIKKSIFSVMNFRLPSMGVLPMHCSANIGEKNDTALFFGLSGTGKTSLSADPARKLIGDDEHGWDEDGIFNFEGGCYAKCIKLSLEKEPQIYNAIRFGSIAENVIYDENTREIDYDSDSITENTRGTYPVEHIDNALIPGIGDHPENIIFLAADAFGVLPPISKLTPEMAMYHFLSGYTAKLAGTEAGVDEPQATFSECFGSPFLPLPATIYTEMLGEKMRKYNADVWLVNTGWSGGGYGVGTRMDIRHTRAMINAAIAGKLQNVEYKMDPFFNVLVPQTCPDVPHNILNPKNTWKEKSAFDKTAKDLSKRFQKNFEKFPDADEEILAAGPKAE